MADSIELYNGRRHINVFNIDYLATPNQQLANAIATGPQDELYEQLERANGYLNRNRQYGSNRPYNPDIDYSVSVTPSWNWRPGSYDNIKKYLLYTLQLDNKAAGLTKYVQRAKDNARWRLDYFLRHITEVERLKQILKREGYSANVDINEYTEKLGNFATKVIEQCNKVTEVTEDKVQLTPYIHITENERNSMFYLLAKVNNNTMNVFQDGKLVQDIPMESMEIIFKSKLRKTMFYLDSKSLNSIDVVFQGLYNSELYKGAPYRSCQATNHPYISHPNWMDDGNIKYGTVCFDKYMDDIRQSFHKVDYITMAMTILQWSSYYSLNHSNPYNSLSMMHLGMPKKFSETYRLSQSRNTDTCASRVRRKYIGPVLGSMSKNYLKGINHFQSFCDNIECEWRLHCDSYINNNKQIKNLLKEESKYMTESLIGAILEAFNNIDDVINLLENEYSCYIYLNCSDPDNVISDWEDVINYITANMLDKYTDIPICSSVLRRIKYWGEEEEKAIPIINNEEIEDAMLRWATERSL